jgi:hypothetical protein
MVKSFVTLTPDVDAALVAVILACALATQHLLTNGKSFIKFLIKKPSKLLYIYIYIYIYIY